MHEVAHGVEVDPWAAAVAVEQRERLQVAEHAVGFARAERREPDLDVADKLGRETAGAAGDERAEGWIADGPDDQFRSRRGHALDMEAFERRPSRRELPGHHAGGASHGRRPAPARAAPLPRRSC